MSRARNPEGRAHARTGAALLLSMATALLFVHGARADADVSACAAGAACDCEADASCWDFAFLSSGRSVVLGLTPALTAVALGGADRNDVAMLASYRVDVYRAHGLLNGHLSANGAIGAGSGGNQGALAGAIDFGVRLPVTTVSGPVFRIGPNAWLLGHDALQATLIEPLRLSAGYQQLSGHALLEAGVTIGVLGSGRFVVMDAGTSLTGSLAFGHYLAAHYETFRFAGHVIYARPTPFGPEVAFGAFQLEGCTQSLPVAICVDARYLQSHLPALRVFAGTSRRERPAARALYAGITLGLTP